MATLHGTTVDAATGEAIDAKVHVLSSRGTFQHPADALLKRGPGTPFFFAGGSFEVEVPSGRTDVLVERGSEYEPARVVVEAPEKGVVEVEVALRRWHHPQEGELVPRQHPHPLRRKGSASGRPPRRRLQRRRVQRHRRQRPRPPPAAVREQQVPDRGDERVHHRPPRPRHRRGEPPLRREVPLGHGLRSRDVPQHPQPRAAGEPRPHPHGAVRPGLPPLVLLLRRRPRPRAAW